MPKNFAQKHHFIWAKLLRFQRTFPEKSFVSGFGADSPDIRRTQKTRISPRFYFFVICWNCVRGPCFKGLFVKSPLKIRKNFPSKTSLHFGESFWDSKGLFSKSPLRLGLGRIAPTDNAHTKSTASPCFFNFYISQLSACSDSRNKSLS